MRISQVLPTGGARRDSLAVGILKQHARRPSAATATQPPVISHRRISLSCDRTCHTGSSSQLPRCVWDPRQGGQGRPSPGGRLGHSDGSGTARRRSAGWFAARSLVSLRRPSANTGPGFSARPAKTPHYEALGIPGPGPPTEKRIDRGSKVRALITALAVSAEGAAGRLA